MKHNEYLTRLDQLNTIRTSSINSSDKTILTLATGALALSIAFLDKIGQPFNVFTCVLIGVTWVGLALVLFLNMRSFHYAKINMDKKIDQLNKNYRNQSKLISSEAKKKFDDKSFPEKRSTERCNKLAARIFFFSMVTFLGYIIAIQINNYCKLDSSSNDTESPIIKPRGEVIMNTGISTPGETETKQELEELIDNKMVDSDLGEGRGLDEIPIAEPAPPEDNTSE